MSFVFIGLLFTIVFWTSYQTTSLDLTFKCHHRTTHDNLILNLYLITYVNFLKPQITLSVNDLWISFAIPISFSYFFFIPLQQMEEIVAFVLLQSYMFVFHPCLLYCHMFVLLMNILGCNLEFRVSCNNTFRFNTNVLLINQCSKPYSFSMHTSLVMHVFYMNYEYETIQREF